MPNASGAARDPASGSLRQQTLSGIRWVTLATAGRNGIGAAVTVLLARLLDPEDFGLLAMVLVFVQFVGLMPQLGLGPALVQARSFDERQLSTVFWLGLTAAALLAGGVAACAPAIGDFYGDPRLVPLALLLALGLVFESISAVPFALLERGLGFHRIAYVELTAGIVGGAVGVASALAGLGAQSLALQLVAGSACVAIGSCFAARWRPNAQLDLASIRPLLRFGAGLLGFQILNYWIRNADNLLLGRFAGSAALGFYATAYRLMLLPLTHVTRIFQRVMFPALSRIQHDPARVKARYLQANRLIGLVTIPAVCGLFVVADPFVRLLLGEPWAPAAALLQLLCLVGVQQPLVATTGWIYQSQGRTDLMFRWAVVSGVVTVAGFAVGLRWGAAGVATSYVVTRYLLCMPAIAIPGRLIGLGFAEFVRNLAGIYGCAAAMALVVFGAGLALPPQWPRAALLAVQVLVGIASFALLAGGARLTAWREARELFREERRRWVSSRDHGDALA